MLLAVVSQVVQTVAPTVAPTATPLVHAVTTTPTISDTLNQLAGRVSPADLMAAAGAFVVGAQYLLNQVSFVKRLADEATKTFNWVISFLLPLLTTFVASVASGSNSLHIAPYVYLIAQFIYFVIEYIKTKAVKSVAPAPAQF